MSDASGGHDGSSASRARAVSARPAVLYSGRRAALVTVLFLLLALFGLLLTPLGTDARDYAEAFSIVARAADVRGPLRRVADLGTAQHTERVANVPVPDGSIRVRIYAPLGTPRQTVLLVTGLHPAGIDEPRLMAFARELARTRVTVVTPEIPGLRDFAIASTLTDAIEDVAGWLAVSSGLAPDSRIGLIGISFSGGLAVVAAGRPSLRSRVSYVLSVAGHGDLPRVLRYLCTGEIAHPAALTSPDAAASHRPPHDYGLAVVLLNIADRLVPADQVDALRALVRRFLWAAYLNRDDRARAAQEFAAVRRESGTMPEPAGTLLGYLNDRNVEQLGSRLLVHIGDHGNEPSLSPSRSVPPAAPVFLLHGRDDNVIPALESQYLADHLRGKTCVTLLLTDLLSHADTDQPQRPGQVFKLMRLWRDLLGHATGPSSSRAAHCA